MHEELRLAPLIDHTLLHPEASDEQIIQLCQEAHAWGCAAVCVLPDRVQLSSNTLAELGSAVEVCTVAGFPLGVSYSRVKALEAELAVGDGAMEVDMVINFYDLIQGRDYDVCADIAAVRIACAGATLKVILETALLDQDQIVRGCQLAQRAGADWVKTSTGTHQAGGASFTAVKTMHDTVGGSMGVKASGGIRDRDAALEMIAVGATRLGVSATREILRGELSDAELEI